MFFIALIASASAQDILPPVLEWHGKSESLIAKKNDKWITPAEKSDFRNTPNYEETMAWFKKLTDASPLLEMVSIGRSVEGREIMMIIASTDKVKTASALKQSSKPLFLAQAGIHSGEIDGKDAGMMLLRDIAFGKKESLIQSVNFLFIPILSVDAHENASPYNRPNQRGPENMGWRTNAQNLNLNRDYSKLDTREIQSVVGVMNTYDPLLYMDIHVTDGADYQFDITYSGENVSSNSPALSNWLATTFKQYSDQNLKKQGHIPGPLMFAVNDRDFTEGNLALSFGTRFSDSYGLARHTCSILVENHSLKPFKQRVLGTYVLLESTLQLLAEQGASLKAATVADRNKRQAEIPMSFKVPQFMEKAQHESLTEIEKSNSIASPDSMLLLGIEPKWIKSEITNSEYVQWTGKRTTETIAYLKETEPVNFVKRPKGYWIPASCDLVIERLKMHGFKMEILTEPRQVKVEMYRIANPDFTNGGGHVVPFEGHIMVSGETLPETRNQEFAKGSAYISTDQPLGELAMILLEPISDDSFFTWGFFHSIFQRTEYIEAYVMEPMAKKMLADSPELRKEYEEKMKDESFANNPNAILGWFYSKTPYYDDRYLLYPIARDLGL